MNTHVERLIVSCALLVACDTVLGISEPRSRPDDKGASDASGGQDESDDGGESGAPPVPAGGAAGDGGEGNLGGTSHVPKECTPDERRCGGESSLTPELCSESREWIEDRSENGGNDCQRHCVDGRCVDCVGDERGCDGRLRQSCEDGKWVDQLLCDAYCDAGECVYPPSCPEERKCAGDASCCESRPVVGGCFKRDYDGETYDDPGHPARISSFLLDTFEVTVGRMRKFVAAYDEIILENGAGKAPHIVADQGWRNEYWDEQMPSSTAELVTTIQCGDHTWTDESTFANELLPINCVPFYVAYAFCVWDGGRLPTEAEWNYAAAGGKEHRAYPWFRKLVDNDTGPNHAYFDQDGGLPIAVGSKPDGKGLWEHQDLAGNVYEWNLDFYGNYPEECVDCLNVAPSGAHSIRGGAYLFPIAALAVPERAGLESGFALPEVGFRCARDVSGGEEKANEESCVVDE